MRKTNHPGPGNGIVSLKLTNAKVLKIGRTCEEEAGWATFVEGPCPVRCPCLLKCAYESCVLCCTRALGVFQGVCNAV